MDSASAPSPEQPTDAAATVDKKRLHEDLEAGPEGYDRTLGSWWSLRACDERHAEAYDHIVDHLANNLPQPPRRILDYGCGTGEVLRRLGERFPDAHLHGIDGSEKMVDEARERLAAHGMGERCTLEVASLPDPETKREAADLVVFCFPNILPVDEGAAAERYTRKHNKEAKVARQLVKAMRKEGLLDKEDDKDWQITLTMLDRMVIRHLRQLTSKDGHCARITYTMCPRDQIDPTDLKEVRFAEGTLSSFKGQDCPRFFKLLSSTYRMSEVILDVEEQGGTYWEPDEEDEDTGGYMINILAPR